MPTLLRRILPALVCTLTFLALPAQSRAQDDTNAALITDGGVWAQYMNQVMGGTSAMLQQPGGTIRGPMGIYANVRLSDVLLEAFKVVCPIVGMFPRCQPNPAQVVDEYLTNYFGNLLVNQAVSGILLETDWYDLQPKDPGPLPPTNQFTNMDSFYFNYVDDAFKAIILWNKAHPHTQFPKTLQLGVSPGFHSPLNINTTDQSGSNWLGGYLNSCDSLFMGSGVTIPVSGSTTLTGCGYTNIFYQTENAPHVQLLFPMPWNTTYKGYWQAFLSALNQHITTSKYEDTEYASVFVSISVGGPTASSNEMILPNGDQADDCEKHPKNPTNRNACNLTLPFGFGSGNPTVSVYTAWNCLLGNNYGVAGNCISDSSYGLTSGSSYIDSNRAFVEEWAAAIDMYGGIFNGVTLIVSRGNGLPKFPSPSNTYLNNAPPAFSSNCGIPSATNMDCAAETAIVAYFAGPPIGPNAKGTAMAGLKAGDLTVTTGMGSTSRPVKWLTYNTTPSIFLSAANGPSVLKSGSSKVLVSRMLGGLQLSAPFSVNPEIEGCLSGTCTPENALLSVLTAYFSGTSPGSFFPNGGTSTIAVGSETVTNAPLNWLQIWDTDIRYALGWSNVDCLSAMFESAPTGKTPIGCTPENMSKHTVNVGTSLGGGFVTAQDLLNTASGYILYQTAVPVALSPTCCPATEYPFPRNAFIGDPVCVTSDEYSEVAGDNAATASNYLLGSNYTKVPTVPYGVCLNLPNLGIFTQYRQSYMGDYVCVPQSHANDIQTQNETISSRVVTNCPP